MHRIEGIDDEQISQALAYAGYVLLAFEIIRGAVVNPIKAFYANTSFGSNMPFKSYEEDVRSRHKKEFEACLLYLRDFVQAIDADDYEALLDLRSHRNELAHELPTHLVSQKVDANRKLLDSAHNALFRLSNNQAYMDIGSDPEFKGIDWSTEKGHAYALLETVIGKAKLLQIQLPENPTVIGLDH